MEVSELVAGMLLDALSGVDLDLHLTGSDGVVASVKLVKLPVDVFRNCDGFDVAVLAAFCAVSVYLGEVNGGDGLNAVEVVVVHNLGSGQIAAHDPLGGLHVPRRAVEAGGVVSRTDERFSVARRLHSVESLEFHGFEQRFEDVQGGAGVDAGRVAEDHLVEELDHGGGDHGVSG